MLNIANIYLRNLFKSFLSLETLDYNNQIHNDIKPQNFLVKFMNGETDLTKIEIVLTDFGMAGPDSKGGTPIFACPECFERKEIRSDIFSFGRVIMFMLLSKERFVKWLFVPIRNSNIPHPTDIFILVKVMTSMDIRMEITHSRSVFESFRNMASILPTQDFLDTFDSIINENINDLGGYISELTDFR